jgi:hypothetical protein
MSDKYFYNVVLMHQKVTAVDRYLAHDRNGVLMTPHPDMVTLRPIGKLLASLPNFADLMESRAIQLINIAGNRKIFVFWSGGLDSTGVLVALMKNCPLDQIVVIMSDTSVVEAPVFFERYIKDKLEIQWMDYGIVAPHIRTGIAEGIVVTGEIGDQLFGTVNFEGVPDETLKGSWRDGISKDEYWQYKDLVEACPRELDNYADFLWWINYSVKYQQVQMRMILEVKNSVLEQNTFHFFDSNDFNDWTITAPMSLKFPDMDQQKYKHPLRSYIYDYDGDLLYFKNKKKERSLKFYHGRFSRLGQFDMITTNWERKNFNVNT